MLGEITEDGRIVVHDSENDSTPVNLELAPILTNIPQKEFSLERISHKRIPLKLPENIDIGEALRLIFRLPAVGSKGFLVRKVDRSVTGLIARQQCCGPLHLPVADVSIVFICELGFLG